MKNGSRTRWMLTGGAAAAVLTAALALSIPAGEQPIRPVSVVEIEPMGLPSEDAVGHRLRVEIEPAGTAPGPSAPPLAARPERKTAQLPDGTVVIENHPVRITWPDGRVEERFVTVTAKPIQKPVNPYRRDPDRAR